MLRFRFSLLLALTLLPSAAFAQKNAFRSGDDSIQVIRLVERYLTHHEAEPIPVEEIDSFAIDEFKEWLVKNHGVPIRFPKNMPHAIVGARPLRSDGSLVSAVVAVDAAQVPLFGPMTVEWVFFARPSDSGAWRISSLRRQNGVEDVASEFAVLDTSSLYPVSLKSIIVREHGSSLLSNEQLRSHFRENRGKFDLLARQFNQRDSLWMIGRIDEVATQINQFGIVWGDAAQSVPPDAIEELMKKLTPEQRTEMEGRLRGVEAARRSGLDSMKNIARRLRLSPKRLDSTLALMHELRVSFANSRLPWKGAVQFTVGGKREDVLGYLYSPSGEIPLVSPEEYFYLEELGEGWYFFRAT